MAIVFCSAMSGASEKAKLTSQPELGQGPQEVVRTQRIPWWLVALDFLTIQCAIGLVIAFRLSELAHLLSPKFTAQFQLPVAIFYAGAGVIVLGMFRINNLYRYKVIISLADQFVQILKSFVTVAIGLIVVIFFLKDTPLATSARGYLLGFVIGGVGLVMLERSVIRWLVLRKVVNLGEGFRKRALVVGAGRAGEKFALRVLNDPELDIERVWFVDDDPKKIGKTLLGFPILGPIDDIMTHVLSTGADEIYIFMNSVDYDRLLEIIHRCKTTGLPVMVHSRRFEIIVREGKNLSPQDELGYIQLTSPFVIRPNDLAKRLLDLVLATSMAAVLLLPSLLIALLIKLTSQGPVLYTTYRVGKGGKLFKMFKFRTMYVGHEHLHRKVAQERLRQGKFMGKVEDDPRITPIGRFLRKYSIDEIPQLINVLRGEMSLVGPRPCLPYEMDYFDDWHKRRFLVLPGITGLWQVTGREKSEQLSIHEAMILDVFYAENYNIWMDIKILLKTIPVVLRGKGGK